MAGIFFVSAPCDVAGESNVMSHSVLISACLEGTQWQADSAVLRAMLPVYPCRPTARESVHVLRASSGRQILQCPCGAADKSHVMCHSALISACVEGKQWQAYFLFSVLRAMLLVSPI